MDILAFLCVSGAFSYVDRKPYLFLAVPCPERIWVFMMKREVVAQRNVKQFTEEEWVAMGRRIREAREVAGMRQIDLALQLAIGKNQMYRIEYGLTPCKTEYLFEIAQILGVSLDYLYFGKAEKESSDSAEVVQEIVTLCKGKDTNMVRKALSILEAFFG